MSETSRDIDFDFKNFMEELAHNPQGWFIPDIGEESSEFSTKIRSEWRLRSLRVEFKRLRKIQRDKVCQKQWNIIKKDIIVRNL